MGSVYGPVISWRLGRSLGIDPLPSVKTCTFECIYCQLRKTVNKVLSPEEVNVRVHVGDVLNDLNEYLRTIDIQSIDYITFSGTGEPTLNLEIGDIVRDIRKLLGGSCPPIAILTNSSLTFRDDVRRNLSMFDLIIAKLDVANSKLFREINRPTAGIELNDVIDGLKKLRMEVKGRLTSQTMLLRDPVLGIDNTGRGVVNPLIDIVRTIGFNGVFLDTPWRPTYEKHVQPIDFKELKEIAELFRSKLPGVEVNCYEGIKQAKVGRVKAISREDIMLLLRRRPCRFIDLAVALGLTQHQLKMLSSMLKELVKEGMVEVKIHHGERFYQA